MIIVKIQGGIGNQLFQYALALTLKKRNPDITIALDITQFYTENNHITPRKFSLNAFCTESFKEADITDILGKNIFLKIKNKLRKIWLPAYKKPIVVEQKKSFDPSVLNIQNNTYLNGYWQSYQYFKEVDDLIRSQLKLKTKLESGIKDILLSEPVSVGLHVRRGDYVDKYADIYVQLNDQYYYNAIEFIKSKIKVEKITIFVFSDDIEWCKLNLNFLDKVVYIKNTLKPDYEDLILMSLCNHNIISNSSYSWWAAWLNNNINKIVVAPINWYRNQEPLFHKSIYPPTWTLL